MTSSICHDAVIVTVDESLTRPIEVMTADKRADDSETSELVRESRRPK